MSQNKNFDTLDLAEYKLYLPNKKLLQEKIQGWIAEEE